MKKILGLTIAIVLIIGMVAGGTWAYFSDTETSAGNAFTAGTIDLDEIGQTITIKDIKPCLTEWGFIQLHNIGENDGNVWLHFTNVLNFENLIVDPEAEAYWANSDYDPDKLRYDNFLECFTTIDVYIDPLVDGLLTGGGSYVIIADDHWKLADLECQWIPLGALNMNNYLEIWISFHIQDEAGNEFQSDTVQFDLEVLLQQTNAPAPTPEWPSDMRVLRLENKDKRTKPTSAADMVGKEYWTPMYGDGTYAVLTYDSVAQNFNYTLEAYGLTPGQSYSLIYYADPWPGTGGCLIDTMTADAAGAINQTGSVELNMDLPTPGDANFSDGAKVWLVPSSDYSTATPGVSGQISGWNPNNFLFEMRLITYNDTGV